MSTEREMLEAAARAAGIEGQWADPGELHAVHYGLVTFLGLGSIKFWNPLTDDGDALRLAVKLGFTMEHAGDYVAICAGSRMAEQFTEAYGRDRNAATRLAIVRAAASIGRAG